MYLRLAITGGMGCGKSQVLQRLHQKGWGTADADQLVHQLFKSDEQLRSMLIAIFGSQVIKGTTDIDRAYLARCVFDDQKALAQLEAAVHPKVQALWQSCMQTHVHKPWAIEVPLLFEKNFSSDFDCALCVAACEGTQIKRLQARGWPEAMIQNRLKFQWPLKNKIEAANFVLLNEGNLDFLHKQVEELIRQLGI